jgi:hypothetical protein
MAALSAIETKMNRTRRIMTTSLQDVDAGYCFERHTA